jgi:hypothetical protein
MVDHGSSNPAINTAYFSNTDTESWWTIHQKVDDPDQIWVVNTGGGLGPHPKDESISTGEIGRAHV